MYVVLNGSAVVYHENPDASLIDEWTEWRIDLQAFADQGVDLANVNSIGIGIKPNKTGTPRKSDACATSFCGDFITRVTEEDCGRTLTVGQIVFVAR